MRIAELVGVTIGQVQSLINAAIGALTKASVGLGNVDNTSDANKPVSTATQTALNGKANTSHTQAWGTITSTPTTLAGYGINDAASSSALTAHTSNTSNPHGTTAAQLADFTSAAQTATAPATFTSSTRASTAPSYSGQVGFETDTGFVFRATGTSVGNWANPMPLNRQVLYNPWPMSSADLGSTQTFATGTGANGNTSDANAIGGFCSEINTGTGTLTGVIRSMHRVNGASSGRGSILPSSFSRMQFAQRILIPTLSTGTDTFFINVGFMSITVSGADLQPMNAVMVRISGTSTMTASLIARASDTDTTIGSVNIAANTVYDIVLTWTISGSLTATVNGTSLGTLTTGLPATSVTMSAQVQVIKNAGTTSRTIRHGAGYFMGVLA